MDHLSHELGTYHYVLHLANAFSSIVIALESQEQFAFTWEGLQWSYPKVMYIAPPFATAW